MDLAYAPQGGGAQAKDVVQMTHRRWGLPRGWVTSC